MKMFTNICSVGMQSIIPVGMLELHTNHKEDCRRFENLKRTKNITQSIPINYRCQFYKRRAIFGFECNVTSPSHLCNYGVCQGV